MANLFLTGSGVPTNAVGEVTDYYRDTSTNLIYYHATLGWEPVPSLIPTPDGVGTNWLFGTGAPSNGIGATNDYYRDDDNGSVYRKHAVNGWEAKGQLDFIGVYGVQWGEGTGAPANIPSLNKLPAGSFYLNVATSDIYYKDNTLTWSLKGQLGSGSTGLDAVATAADRVQTGLDAVATAADRVQTGLDVTQTGQDVIATGLFKDEAESQATLSIVQASTATTQAGIATTQAGIATTKAGEATAQATAMTNGKTAKMMVCAIRNTGSGWAYINDSAHEPIRFTGVPTIVTAPEDFKLTLTHTTGNTKVGSLVCVPDETFAPYGVVIGASVGVDSSTLRAGMPLRFRTYGATAVADCHPFFGSRVSIAALGDGTGFTITVPQLQNGTATTMPIVGSVHYSDGRATEIQIKSLSLTQFEVRAVCDYDAYIAYNGSVWNITTDNVLTTHTAVWDSVDTLTVTHNTTGSANTGVIVSQVYGGHKPLIVASSSTTVSIKFVNDAGTVQTTPSTAFKFRLNRPHKFPRTMLSTQTCYFDCGMALLHWGDIVSAGGNIWMMGMMHS